MSNIKICTKCKIELEATSVNFVKQKNGKYGLASVCKVCQKKWRDNRKDIKREYDKKYNIENREKKIEYSRRRYYENIEEMREYYKKRNKDKDYLRKRREYRKTRKERDKELYSIWRKNNTERISTNKQRRYTKMKGLKSDLTHDDWLNTVEYFTYSCAYCGEKSDDLTRDHFIPVTLNGTFTKDNIIPACRSCNSSKNNKEFNNWYPYYEHYSSDREEKIINYIEENKEKKNSLCLMNNIKV